MCSMPSCALSLVTPLWSSPCSCSLACPHAPTSLGSKHIQPYSFSPTTIPLDTSIDLLLIVSTSSSAIHIETLLAAKYHQSLSPKMSQFKQLPAELQIQIFDYLHAADVKSARAVSRTFRNNATPALFRSIVACARYQALGAFQNVSSKRTLEVPALSFVMRKSVLASCIPQDHSLVSSRQSMGILANDTNRYHYTRYTQAM